MRYPDAMIVGGTIDGRARVASDVVVAFEVISPSSAQTDRIVKLREYFGVASIRAYVILEHEFIGLTVFERNESATAWQATALGAEDILRLPHPAVDIPITELYRDVSPDRPQLSGAPA